MGKAFRRMARRTGDLYGDLKDFKDNIIMILKLPACFCGEFFISKKIFTAVFYAEFFKRILRNLKKTI